MVSSCTNLWAGEEVVDGVGKGTVCMQTQRGGIACLQPPCKLPASVPQEQLEPTNPVQPANTAAANTAAAQLHAPGVSLQRLLLHLVVLRQLCAVAALKEGVIKGREQVVYQAGSQVQHRLALFARLP